MKYLVKYQQRNNHQALRHIEGKSGTPLCDSSADAATFTALDDLSEGDHLCQRCEMRQAERTAPRRKPRQPRQPRKSRAQIWDEKHKSKQSGGVTARAPRAPRVSKGVMK